MTTDLFGNLSDWGTVLEKISEIKSKDLLDEHQADLARLLRYRRNWRLLDEALQGALFIRQANDILIVEALNVLVSQEVWLGSRILAAQALGHLLSHRVPQGSPGLDPARVLQNMRDQAAIPGPPVLVDAIRNAIEEAQKKKPRA